jgi:hypothetical protein
MLRMHRVLFSSGLLVSSVGALACGMSAGCGESKGTMPSSESATQTGQNTAGSGGNPGLGGSGGSGGSAGSGGSGALNIAWDLTGIVGTGQSLSVGAMAGTPTANAMTQQFKNLKLSLGTLVVPPLDEAASQSDQLSLVPLVEPIRPVDPGYPSAYPGNLDGESPHTAMSVQLTSMAMADGASDFVTVHTVVGESGQGMSVIDKSATVSPNGPNSARAYAATLFEARAIKRLAAAQNKTYGIGAIFLTHGETDAGNAGYEDAMLKLYTDYNADLKAITGQEQSIPLFTSQQHGIYMYTLGTTAASNINTSTKLQWQASLDHPDEIVCVGPKYQYPYYDDYLHLVAEGYELMGEKYAQAYYERVVLGHEWKPLQPLASTIARSGRNITVDFFVPKPPLAWDDALPKPHQSDLTEWKEGRGFEVRSSDRTPLAIESVSLVDADTVQVTLAADVPAGAILGYAATNGNDAVKNFSPRIGNLRDSDPFVGAMTKKPQPNYSVAFELPVP